jgi:hypothetical protein
MDFLSLQATKIRCRTILRVDMYHQSRTPCIKTMTSPSSKATRARTKLESRTTERASSHQTLSSPATLSKDQKNTRETSLFDNSPTRTPASSPRQLSPIHARTPENPAATLAQVTFPKHANRRLQSPARSLILVADDADKGKRPMIRTHHPSRSDDFPDAAPACASLAVCDNYTAVF